jgi:hypothetical protein
MDAGFRSSTFLCAALDALDVPERTDVPDELRLSIPGGINFDKSVAGRFGLAADNVDVVDAADGRRGRLILGVEGVAPTLDAVDAADVLRERETVE